MLKKISSSQSISHNKLDETSEQKRIIKEMFKSMLEEELEETKDKIKKEVKEQIEEEVKAEIKKGFEREQKDLIIRNIASNAVDYLLSSKYKQDFSKFEYSKRKLTADQVLILKDALTKDLKNLLSTWSLDTVRASETELAEKLTYSLSKKIDNEKSSETSYFFKNFRQPGVFETKGVLFRNGLGENDSQIVMENLKERIKLALHELKDSDVEFSDFSLSFDSEESGDSEKTKLRHRP